MHLKSPQGPVLRGAVLVNESAAVGERATPGSPASYRPPRTPHLTLERKAP